MTKSKKLSTNFKKIKKTVDKFFCQLLFTFVTKVDKKFVDNFFKDLLDFPIKLLTNFDKSKQLSTIF